MNVDRLNRDKLVDAIRRYVDEEITAFDFDDEIFGISEVSTDPTIERVVLALWTLYDDCKDHKVVLSKDGWDYCQRLMLLLESDAQIEAETRKRWSITQLFAGVAFLAFVGCVTQLGIGYHLFAVAIPFGLVSMALFHLKERFRSRIPAVEETAMTPFSRVSEILSVRRQVPNFLKRKYPASLGTRRIRSALMHSALLLPWLAVWLMMSPLVLLVQMMPATEAQTRVVTS